MTNEELLDELWDECNEYAEFRRQAAEHLRIAIERGEDTAVYWARFNSFDEDLKTAERRFVQLSDLITRSRP